MAGKHLEEIALKKLHKLISNATENGACLTGHNSRYAKVSCAYRWQAHKVSLEERSSIYNGKTSKKKEIKTNVYETNSGGFYPPPKDYNPSINPPTNIGDWDLDGPKVPFKPFEGSKKKIPKGENFTKTYWPYWHNAHHLIPKGLFNSLISETSCSYLICQSLLEAKYNINHKINMMILPQDKEVGKILKLPRHLILREKSREEFFDHTAYNNLVKSKLKQIIDNYKELCDKPKKKDHKIPKPTLDKKKLEKLSKDCYSTIVQFGKISAGEPLADIPKIISKK